MPMTHLSKDQKSGFTLIELLVVIAILAILAVAVLSAINPIEQINRGSDAAKKSDMAELLNAYERYFTTYQTYPWDPDKDGTPVLDKQQASVTAASGIDELVTKDELKPQFKTRRSLTTTFVTQQAGTNLIAVCFDPVSKNFGAQADKNQDGTTGCTTATCYVCVPE